MGSRANAEQALRWNGEGGQVWIAHRERHVGIRQRLLPHLFRAAAISPGDHVLDVGCGCGETTIAAARAAGEATPDVGHDRPGGGAVGLDLSAPMLAVARRLAAEAGVANVRFVEGDAQVYPLSPNSYDVVISSFGVMFFDDPAAAFGNILSALRPGGRLAFLCWQDVMRNEAFAIPLRAYAAHRPLPEREDDVFADPRWLEALLAGAGCEGIEIEAINEVAWLGSDVADVMGYIRGTPRVRALLAELDDETSDEVLATMAEEYAPHQRPDGVWVGAAALLASARVGVHQ